MERETHTETHNTTNPGHTTVVRERSGSGGIMIALVVVVGLVIAAFLFARGQNSEIARDNAIAGAAQQVGNSVESAGQAVENAANNATNND